MNANENSNDQKHEATWSVTTRSGLTKREYFAGLAMQGLLATDYDGLAEADKVATAAVEQADALLAELAKEPK